MMIADPAALDFALAYAARGWAVLALWWGEDGICACPRGSECESAGKHPIAFIGKRAICPNGVKDATLDPERISQWWARVPDANVGIATGAASGLVVLDSDPRNGGDESLVILANSMPGGLPETPRSITGSGGEHLLFAAPAGRVANFKGRDWGFPGLDVKGDGGYIVAPPSLHVSGRRYQWDGGAHPDDLALAPLPTALARRLGGGAGAATSAGLGTGTGSPTIVTAGGTDVGAVLAGVPEGERGVSIFRLAAKLRRVDVPYAVARELVFKAAAAASPPYQPAAALKHLDSAYSRYEPSEGTEPEAEGAEENGTAGERFRWLSLDELETAKPPTWLIDNVLVAGSFTMVAGRERSLKSFSVLDMGLSVAAGAAWQGMRTMQGPVGYVVAEGQSGVSRRVDAWCQARGHGKPTRFRVLPQPVQLLVATDVDELLASILAWPAMPVLIIIDTLARCFVGGEENSAKDMGEFIAACDRLQRSTGATVLVVHHGTKADGGARGSSALLAAVDTHIAVSRDMDANKVTLKCEKQKDADEFEPLVFEPVIVPLPVGETSLVLEPARITVESLKRTPKTMLEALRRFERAASNGEWERASVADGVARRSFYRAKKELIEDGRVIVHGQDGAEIFHENASDVYECHQCQPVPNANDTRNLRSANSATLLKSGTWHHGLAPETAPSTRLCEDCDEPTGSDLQRFCPVCRMKPEDGI